MYIPDQQIISDYALTNGKQFASTITFAIVSANKSFYKLPSVLSSINTERPHLSKTQLSGIEFINQNSKELLEQIKTTYSLYGLMSRYTRIPGLGLIKAGFVCQLIHGQIGCIDVHNARLYGVKTPSRYTPKGIRDYIAVCHAIGSSEFLWNTWCEHLATNSKHFDTADQVSKFHISTIKGIRKL